jgi:hypothetical protein
MLITDRTRHPVTNTWPPGVLRDDRAKCGMCERCFWTVDIEEEQWQSRNWAALAG